MAENDFPAIETEGLTKSFGAFRAVDGVDLTVPSGTVCAVLGPNGAGKTTTVRMIATLLRPDRGAARVFGYDVVREATAVRSLIGLTGQYASVDEGLTARENLTIFGRLLDLSGRVAAARAEELLAEFGLAEAAGRSVRHFSGGMRRRLDLAASLIARPPLLFLDEPTTGLDPRTRAQMWGTVRELVRAGTTVLLTTQYLDEADELADRIVVIDHGRLVADGTADDLKATIGATALTLRVLDADIAVAIEIVRDYLPPGSAVTAENGKIAAASVPMTVLPELLAALRTAAVEVREVNVAQPSLDEVFFAITGRPESVAAAGAA
ncbi:ATP-binding cassette domain-containing protein [Nocardia callitridis]|uniref:Daunorubicin resistance protein DrrA family ABC transporter ATP-binding protein n=1 Tax=Nocardia callitridis TaxID=648753 RepID=A0ABP9KNV9_9NOCA